MTDIVSEGGCLCGAVRYRITGEPRSSSTCFCRSCRLASGATPVAWLVVGLGQYAAAEAGSWPPSARPASRQELLRALRHAHLVPPPRRYRDAGPHHRHARSTGALSADERDLARQQGGLGTVRPALARFSQDSDGPRLREAHAVGQA
jgi:hypothetical protein